MALNLVGWRRVRTLLKKLFIPERRRKNGNLLYYTLVHLSIKEWQFDCRSHRPNIERHCLHWFHKWSLVQPKWIENNCWEDRIVHRNYLPNIEPPQMFLDHRNGCSQRKYPRNTMVDPQLFQPHLNPNNRLDNHLGWHSYDALPPKRLDEYPLALYLENRYRYPNKIDLHCIQLHRYARIKQRHSPRYFRLQEPALLQMDWIDLQYRIPSIEWFQRLWLRRCDNIPLKY